MWCDSLELNVITLSKVGHCLGVTGASACTIEPPSFRVQGLAITCKNAMSSKDEPDNIKSSKDFQANCQVIRAVLPGCKSH